MFIAKKILKHLKYVYLLTYIQSKIRMLKPRKMYLQKRRASSVLSAWIKMILQRKKFLRMIHDIHENNKLSNQLEFLRNQLLREAEERQIAEEVNYLKKIIPFQYIYQNVLPIVTLIFALILFSYQSTSCSMYDSFLFLDCSCSSLLFS